MRSLVAVLTPNQAGDRNKGKRRKRDVMEEKIEKEKERKKDEDLGEEEIEHQ